MVIRPSFHKKVLFTQTVQITIIHVVDGLLRKVQSRVTFHTCYQTRKAFGWLRYGRCISGLVEVRHNKGTQCITFISTSIVLIRQWLVDETLILPDWLLSIELEIFSSTLSVT